MSSRLRTDPYQETLGELSGQITVERDAAAGIGVFVFAQRGPTCGRSGSSSACPMRGIISEGRWHPRGDQVASEPQLVNGGVDLCGLTTRNVRAFVSRTEPPGTRQSTDHRRASDRHRRRVRRRPRLGGLLNYYERAA